MLWSAEGAAGAGSAAASGSSSAGAFGSGSCPAWAPFFPAAYATPPTAAARSNGRRRLKGISCLPGWFNPGSCSGWTKSGVERPVGLHPIRVNAKKAVLSQEAADSLAREPDRQRECHDGERRFLVSRDPLPDPLEANRSALWKQVGVEDQPSLHRHGDQGEGRENDQRLPIRQLGSERVDTGGDDDGRVDPEGADQESPDRAEIADPRHPTRLLRKLPGTSRPPRPESSRCQEQQYAQQHLNDARHRRRSAVAGKVVPAQKNNDHDADGQGG